MKDSICIAVDAKLKQHLRRWAWFNNKTLSEAVRDELIAASQYGQRVFTIKTFENKQATAQYTSQLQAVEEICRLR